MRCEMVAKNEKDDKDRNRPDDFVHLKVATPRGNFDGRVSTSTTVIQFIKQIVDAMKIETPIKKVELFKNDLRLEPVDQPLSKFNLSDNDVLSLGAHDQGVYE